MGRFGAVLIGFFLGLGGAALALWGIFELSLASGWGTNGTLDLHWFSINIVLSGILSTLVGLTAILGSVPLIRRGDRRNS